MNRQMALSPFRRYAPAIALSTAAILLMIGLGIIVYGTRFYARQEIREAGIQASILASTVTAALAFDDPTTAQEYVNALEAAPGLQIAAIYDAQGRRFVSYARSPANRLPGSAPPDQSTIDRDRLMIAAPVQQGGVRLGTVYLETIIEPTSRRVVRYGLIALLMLMTSLVVAVLGVSQRALTNANAELEKRAAALAAVNVKLREQIDETEKVEAALRQSQKVEAIGQLTGGVAHDFNNLLHIILSSLETVLRRSKRWNLIEPQASELNQFLAAAIQGGERAAGLTRQLLAFSRRQPLAPKATDVNKLVGGMSDLLRRTLGEGIAIETILAGGLWPVFTDPNQLESALLNLAVNARDAMPDGGRLTIETANAHLDEAYVRSHDDVTVGQYVVMAVTDNGIGMSKEIMAQAFDPFFTTKDIGHGTGLGLSQVYGFVKQSGGHIKIYSEVGEGTTMKLYLPRHLSGDELETPPSDRAPLGIATGECILAVEDEDNVRASTVDMLHELGYRVLEARDGRQALQILDNEPDILLLFTDVGLPGGMNGRQLADEARRRRPDLKVLFTTGYARNAIVHHGRLDPGVELIPKPFTYAALAEKVRQTLAASGSAG